MTEHVSQEQLRMMKAGTLGPEELIRFDRHIASCAACRDAVRASATAAEISRRLSRALLGFDHLSFSQLEGYLDGRLSKEERAAVNEHIETCSECNADITDLSGNTLPASQPVSTSRPSIFASFLSRPVPVFASLVVLAATASVIVLLLTRSEVPENTIAETTQSNALAEPTPVIESTVVPETSPVPEETLVVAMSDGGETVGLNKNGELSGYDSVPSNYRIVIKNAIANGKLAVPDLRDLHAAAGPLMGD